MTVDWLGLYHLVNVLVLVWFVVAITKCWDGMRATWTNIAIAAIQIIAHTLAGSSAALWGWVLFLSIYVYRLGQLTAKVRIRGIVRTWKGPR